MLLNINAAEKDYNIVKERIKHNRARSIVNNIKKYGIKIEHKWQTFNKNRRITRMKKGVGKA